MAEDCPICRTIEGKSPGKGQPCADCNSNLQVRTAYDWIDILRSQLWIMRLYAYGLPLLMIADGIVRAVKHMNAFWFVMDILPWGVWVFNVFYFWPKQGIPIRGCSERWEKAKADLFLAKLGGCHGEEG